MIPLGELQLATGEIRRIPGIRFTPGVSIVAIESVSRHPFFELLHVTPTNVFPISDDLVSNDDLVVRLDCSLPFIALSPAVMVLLHFDLRTSDVAIGNLAEFRVFERYGPSTLFLQNRLVQSAFLTP